MTTETQTSNSQLTLKDKLVVLNADQYQAVFALYGQTGFDKYDTLVKDNAQPDIFQSELATFIEKDTNQQQKSKLTALIDKYYEDYNAEKTNLDTLAAAAKSAVIDECEEQYKKEVIKEATTIVKVAKAVISSGDIDNPKSDKGTKEVMTLCFPKEDKPPIAAPQTSAARQSADAANSSSNSKAPSGVGFGGKK